MGLDYAFNLYFPVARVGVALRELARFAPAGDATIVRLLDEEVSVPFSADWKHDPVELRNSGDTVKLETSLLFPIDEAIRSGEFCHSYEPVGDTECAQIGYIYLTIRLGCLYSEFTFQAATSGMSRLFVASDAIRGRFRELLAAGDGVVAWLDKEDFEFYSLDDPNKTITPEFVPQIDHEDMELWSPDWAAAKLCQGVGRSLPGVEAVLGCRTTTAVGLARMIHATKSFDALPILADALQDAECENQEVLNHCRHSGPHGRGCFVIDLLRASTIR